MYVVVSVRDIEAKKEKKVEDENGKIILKMRYYFSIDESIMMDNIITLIFRHNAIGFNGA